jgi:hypothetical protein
VSRLLLNNVFDSIEDDESPRDAAEFPFFADSVANHKCVTVAKENAKRGDSNSEASYDASWFSCAPSSPKCPPTVTKKSNRRKNLSPPKSLKAHGRADSFLQMFSHEPLVLMDDEDMKSDASAEGYSLKAPDDIRERRSSPVHSSIEPQHSSFSRFLADFEVVGTLGNGSFGCVYKVRNRMDRRMYAIKAAKREARGLSDRDHMLQEVYALAALSDDTTAAAMHIVRYHQAWMEGNRLYIQTELCDGNLEKEMAQGVMDEKRRYKVLREMLLALDLVHKSGMIHLDIKVCED